MLHMVVNAHNPESCAFRGTEEDELLTKAVEAFTQPGPESVLRIEGSWINRIGHEFFLLVDAPNAHVVEESLVASGLIGRTHSRVLSVLPAAEVQVST